MKIREKKKLIEYLARTKEISQEQAHSVFYSLSKAKQNKLLMKIPKVNLKKV